MPKKGVCARGQDVEGNSRIHSSNLFFLLIILAGAGAFLVLGTVVKEAHLSHDIEWIAYGVSAVASIFASYYAGKFVYRMIERG